MNDRLFNLSQFLQPARGEPMRAVVTQPTDATVVAWFVPPGQRITPHWHPNGQDTWMVISGPAEYPGDALGRPVRIVAGNVVVAAAVEVHRVL